MTNSHYKLLSDEMRAGFAAVNRKLNILTKTVSSLEGRMDAFAKYTQSIERGLIGLNKRVRKLEDRVQAIEVKSDDAH